MSENPRERKSRGFAFNGFSVGCRSRATACGRLMKSRSTRRLALITYHYRSKDILWQAAAEHAFANGYINEYPTGRLWRDAKLYEIGAGTSEIRRMLIGRELFAETA
jgi:isovaleryl-CoA dehydrogenase